MSAPLGKADAAPARARRRRSAPLSRPHRLERILRRPEQVTAGLLVIIVSGSALAIGAVHVVTVVCVSVVAALSAGLALSELRREGKGLPLGSALMLLLAGYSALQAVPLPPSIVRAVSPTGYEVWLGTLDLLGQPSAWMSISLDPRASLVEALKWATYSAVYATAVYLGRQDRLATVLLTLFGTALVLALVTLSHRAVGATRLYGFYEPVHANPYFALAPLLNPNNLAGYLNLGAFAGLGLGFSRLVAAGPRWMVVGGVSVVMAVTGLSGSRGGWVALAVGLLALVTAFLLQPSRLGRLRGRIAALVPLGALLGGGALFALSAQGELWAALLEEGAEKFEFISWSVPLISDYPATGVGRGAFETAFASYRRDMGRHVYSHAENFIAHWAAEWGVIVAALALVGFAWLCRPPALGVKTSRAAMCTAVGLAALLLHNLVDLAFEVASVSIAFSAAFGVLVGSARHGGFTKSRLYHKAFPAALVCLALFTLALGTSTVLDERRIFGSAVSGLKEMGDADQRRTLDSIRAAMRWRPADPFLPYLGGILVHQRGENALPWIARAIERDPMDGRPHLLLAHALARRGAHGQSRLSLRMALERDYSLTQSALGLAFALGAATTELLQVAPEGARGAAVLLAMARKTEDVKMRGELLEEAIRRDPDSVETIQTRAGDLLEALVSKSGVCQGNEARICSERVLVLAGLLEHRDGHWKNAQVIKARVQMSQGRLDDARMLLAAGCPDGDPQLECIRWRVVAAREAKAPSELLGIANGLLNGSCTPVGACADVCARLGGALSEHELWGPATELYERSARIVDSSAAWERVSLAAVRAGMNGAAIRAIQRADAARARGK